jgi:hypothetical protein
MGRKIKNLRQQRIKVPVIKEVPAAYNKAGKMIRKAFEYRTDKVITILHKK